MKHTPLCPLFRAKFLALFRLGPGLGVVGSFLTHSSVFSWKRMFF